MAQKESLPALSMQQTLELTRATLQLSLDEYSAAVEDASKPLSTWRGSVKKPVKLRQQCCC